MLLEKLKRIQLYSISLSSRKLALEVLSRSYACEDEKNGKTCSVLFDIHRRVGWIALRKYLTGLITLSLTDPRIVSQQGFALHKRERGSNPPEWEQRLMIFLNHLLRHQVNPVLLKDRNCLFYETSRMPLLDKEKHNARVHNEKSSAHNFNQTIADRKDTGNGRYSYSTGVEHLQVPIK